MSAMRKSRCVPVRMIPGHVVGLIAVLLCGWPALATGAIYRVDGNNGNDANNGASWDPNDALASIQGALAKASNGDEIWVRATTYWPPSQGPVTAILVNKTVGIYGGFAGTELTRDQRDPRAYETTIECPGFGGGNSHGFWVDPGGAAGRVVIDGFRIEYGKAYGYVEHAAGGGIRATSGSVVIANCTFYFCYAYSGGGVSIGGACPQAAVVNCTFRNNSANNYGGGLEASNTGTVAVNCEFYDNSAFSGGAAAYWNGGSIVNCTLARNEAYEAGGGFCAYYQGTTTIANSIIWGNTIGTAPSEIARSYSYSTVNVSYSDVRGGYAGTGNLDQDPLFVLFDYNGDHRVQPFSPCVDAGSNAAIPADAADLDQDGDSVESLPLDLLRGTRIADGDESGTATVDMGAFEYVPGSATLRTLNVIIDPSPAGSVTGSGMACPGTCARAYIDGSRITLTATNDVHGIFERWDDWNTDLTYSLTLTGDQTVVAHFIVPQPGPAIRVTPADYLFDEVSPNGGYYNTFTIRNVGTEPLVLGDILPPTEPFRFQNDPCSGATLNLGETCVMWVGFFPGENDYGHFASNFAVSSNDPLNDPLVVQLRGTVYRDADGDEVSDMREQGPNGDDPAYDGNHDGIPDWQQANVVSLARAEGEGGGYVTFAVPAATGHFQRASADPLSDWLEDPEEPDPPAGVAFLQGLYWFTLRLEPDVSAATVTMYLPAGTYPSRFYQYHDPGEDPNNWYWYEFAFDGQTGAQNAANICTLHFVDGQRGDGNLDEPDGEIWFDGGPAWFAADDDDGDGVPSLQDNCPFTYNPDQHDTDGDGIGDACDGCPFNPFKTQPGACGCNFSDTDADGDGVLDCQDGCPFDRFKTAPGPCGCGVLETDADGDGVPDCLDGCPNDPLKSDPGACGCGQPETDTDGDGVPDCADNCPDVPNADQADRNGDGVGDACTPDTDNDGVPADLEDGAPNGGDGDNDGIPDSQQANVTSLPNTFGAYVTIVAPLGTQLVGVAALENPSPDDTPPDAEFPAGFLAYEIHGLPPGGTADVQIIVHAPPAGGISSYWKHGATPDSPMPHWYEFMSDGTTGAEIAGNVITLHFKDGARGDDDLQENGVVVDPGAPAVYSSAQDIPLVPACGAGACGAGMVGYVPLTLAGICGLRLRQRRRT